MSETLFEKAAKDMKYRINFDSSLEEIKKKLELSGLQYVSIATFAEQHVKEDSLKLLDELHTSDEALAVFRKFNDIGYSFVFGLDNEIYEKVIFVHPGKNQSNLFNPKKSLNKIVKWLQS